MEQYGYRARQHGGKWFYFTAVSDAAAIEEAEKRTGLDRSEIDVDIYDDDFSFWIDVNEKALA